MGNIFGSLKDKLLASLLRSVLPKYVLRYEGDIRRVVLGVNMLIAALYVALPLIPDATEKQIQEHLDYVDTKWKMLLALFNKYTGFELTNKPR